MDSKTVEIRWKEMSTILLWQFDKFLRKNRIGWYNRKMYDEFKNRKSCL